MITVTPQQASARWDLLTPALREAIFSDVNDDFIRKLFADEHIPENKQNSIFGAISCVLLGFLHPEDLPAEIKSATGLDPKLVNTLTSAINQRIFEPIRSDIDRVYQPIISSPSSGVAGVGPKIISSTQAGSPISLSSINQTKPSPVPTPGWSHSPVNQSPVNSTAKNPPAPTPVIPKSAPAAPATSSTPTPKPAIPTPTAPQPTPATPTPAPSVPKPAESKPLTFIQPMSAVKPPPTPVPSPKDMKTPIVPGVFSQRPAQPAPSSMAPSQPTTSSATPNTTPGNKSAGTPPSTGPIGEFARRGMTQETRENSGIISFGKPSLVKPAAPAAPSTPAAPAAPAFKAAPSAPTPPTPAPAPAATATPIAPQQPAGTPPTAEKSAAPPPVLLHQDVNSAAQPKVPDFHLPISPLTDLTSKKAQQPPVKPAVLELGSLPSTELQKPGVVSTRVVHYTEYKSPSPENPTKPQSTQAPQAPQASQTPREVTQITAPKPTPAPATDQFEASVPKPPTPPATPTPTPPPATNPVAPKPPEKIVYKNYSETDPPKK